MIPRPPRASAAPARGRAVPPAPVNGRRTGRGVGAGRGVAAGAGAGGSVTTPANTRGRSSSEGSAGASGGAATGGTSAVGGGAVSGGAVVSGGVSTGGGLVGGTSGGGVPRCAPTAGASNHDPNSTQPMARTSFRNIAPPSSRPIPAAWGWRKLRPRPLTERPTWAPMTAMRAIARRRNSARGAPGARRTDRVPARPAGSRARRSPRRWSRRGWCSTR